MTVDVLALTAGLPERRLVADEVLYGAGEVASDVVVLVEGALEIEVGGVVVATIGSPGAFVGETGALLEQPRSATVTAREPSLVRIVGDPPGFFADRPELGLEVARQLAGRLHRLTAYVSDVQRQFADRDDHLSMFGEVLGRIASRPVRAIDAGSDREPDYQ